MSKYRKLVDSCSYKGLMDQSLLRSTNRSISDKNIHQLIVKNNTFEYTQVTLRPLVHATNAFLIGIINYLPGEPSIHTNHAVSAILTNGRVYAFNAHGIDSQPMGWLVSHLRTLGFVVNDGIQYSGPNLQVLDTQGACTAFSVRFLKLHPNASMDQDRYNQYILNSFFSTYTLPELYKYLNNVKSIRNTGVQSNNNASNMNVNANENAMNINRRRVVTRRRMNTRN